MRNITTTLIAASAGLTLLVAGCSTTPDAQQDGAKVEERSTGKPGAKPQAVQTKPVAPVDVTGKKEAAGTAATRQGVLAQRSIYYDYDQFDVKADYRALVEAHAKYLRENPSAKMLIQGNADERGSREYNLGLGQKRSDGVKKMMTLLGVKENQIESVSLGEEKPQDEGHNESAWAKNRRSDILYSGEY
jgi:peptidoglycan-associated lipoprotein